MLARSSERILIAQICSITTPYLIGEEVWKEVWNCKRRSGPWASAGFQTGEGRGGGQIEKPGGGKSIIFFLNGKNIYLIDFHYVFE